MSETILTTYTLKEPITVRLGDKLGETVTEVEVKKPKGKHLKATDNAAGDAAKMLALIGACTGIPPTGMDEMDAEDIAELGAMLAPFFEKLQRIGAPSSAT